jgi:hypothetical protein
MAADVDILDSQTSLVSAPTGQVAVTPGIAIPRPVRGFIVMAAGNVAATMVDGSVGMYWNCVPGVIYIGIIIAFPTSGTDVGGTITTTATGIRGLY